MINQLSLTFQKNRDTHTHTHTNTKYAVAYCGSTLFNFILKRVAEGVFNAAQLLTHYLSQFQLNPHLLLLHKKKRKILFFGGGGGSVLCPCII